GLSRKHRRPHDAFDCARVLPGAGPSSSMGSVASGVHCSSRGLLSVCPRSCPGSSLFTDTGETTCRNTSANRETIGSSHSTRKARRDDLRYRQPVTPWSLANHLTGGTRPNRRAKPDCGKTSQGLSRLCFSAQIFCGWLGTTDR